MMPATPSICLAESAEVFGSQARSGGQHQVVIAIGSLDRPSGATNLVQIRTVLYPHFALLGVDVGNRAPQVVNTPIEQMMLIAEDGFAFQRVVIKREIEPAWHIGVLAGTLNERHPGFLRLQVAR